MDFTREELLEHLRQGERKVLEKAIVVDKHFSELHGLAMQLRNMGYECESSGSNIVKLIDDNNIDCSLLTFSQGDYATFKKDVEAGVYSSYDDVDYNDMFVTKEESTAVSNGIKTGKFFVIK